jgi:hypothetical protein
VLLTAGFDFPTETDSGSGRDVFFQVMPIVPSLLTTSPGRL